jgi:hypothetical protein
VSMSCANLSAEASLITEELGKTIDLLLARSSAPAPIRHLLDAQVVTPTAHAATAWVADPAMRVELGTIFGLFIWALRLDYRWMADMDGGRPTDVMAVAHESASLGLTRLSRMNGISVLQTRLDHVHGCAWGWTEQFNSQSPQSHDDGPAREQTSWLYLMSCYAVTGAILSDRRINPDMVAHGFEAYMRLAGASSDDALLTSFAGDVARHPLPNGHSGNEVADSMHRSRSILQETLAEFPVADIFESRFTACLGAEGKR